MLQRLTFSDETELQDERSVDETVAVLLMSPMSTAVIVALVTEGVSVAVDAAVTLAARHALSNFSSQRRLVVKALFFMNMVNLVVLPLAVLGDPFSWNSFGHTSTASIFGKCRMTVEAKLGQRLPGAEFIPNGLVGSYCGFNSLTDSCCRYLIC